MNAAELRAWIEDTVGNLVMAAGLAKSKGDVDMGDGFAFGARLLSEIDLDCNHETLLQRMAAAAVSMRLNAAAVKHGGEKSLRDFGYGLDSVADSITDRVEAERVN